MVLTDRAPTADGEGPRDCNYVVYTDRAAVDGEGPRDCNSEVLTDRAPAADGEGP